MSPEQASGQSGVVGQVSDVYSLGATLYCLLTGQPPFAGKSWPPLRDAIRRGEFRRPRQVQPEIPPALEAICLKAMATRPEDRCPTAHELAQEVERWLAGEPVNAWPEPWTVRTRRWLGKHRALVASGVAMLALAVVFLAVLAILVRQQNEKLEEANRREQEQRERAERKEKQAHEQRDLALETMSRVRAVIAARLKGKPALEDLRKQLLQAALDGLEKVARNLNDNADVDRETIRTLSTMGDLLLEYGGLTTALRQYRRVEELFRQLLEKDPTNSDLERDRSVALGRLSDIRLLLGEGQQALRDCEEGLAIRRKLAGAKPTSARARRDLAIFCNKVGEVQLRLGQLEQALPLCREGLYVIRQLAEADPKNPELQRDLSISLTRMGDIALESWQPQEALGFYGEALPMRRKLVEANPDNAEAQRDLSIIVERSGDLSRELGQVRQMLQHYENGLVIRRKLAKADPNNAEVQRDLSNSLERVGLVRQQLGQVQLALTHHREELAIRQQEAQDEPDSILAQLAVVRSLLKLGLGELANSKPDLARQWFRSGADLLTQLDQKGKLQGGARQWLAQVRTQLTYCEVALRAVADPEQALKQPKQFVPLLLATCGVSRVRDGKLLEAVNLANQLANFEPSAPENLFHAARIRALVSAAVKEADKHEEHAAKAVALLQQAHKADYFKAELPRLRLQHEDDLVALRNRPDFQKLLGDLQLPTK